MANIPLSKLSIFKLLKSIDRYLKDYSDAYVIDFQKTRPSWRSLIQRIQSLQSCTYAEVRANLLDQNFRPIDLLRFKLAMFGATKYDPKSNLWLRVSLFQGAPLIDNLKLETKNNLLFPWV